MRGSGWPSRKCSTATASINKSSSSPSSGPQEPDATPDREPLLSRGSIFTFGAVDDAAEEPLAFVSSLTSSFFIDEAAAGLGASGAGCRGGRIDAGARGAAGASGGRTAAAGVGGAGRGAAAAIAARGAGGRAASGGAPAVACGAGAGASSAVVFGAMAATPRDGGRDA